MDYRIRLRHVREDRNLTQSKIGKIFKKSPKAIITLKQDDLN